MAPVVPAERVAPEAEVAPPKQAVPVAEAVRANPTAVIVAPPAPEAPVCLNPERCLGWPSQHLASPDGAPRVVKARSR